MSNSQKDQTKGEDEAKADSNTGIANENQSQNANSRDIVGAHIVELAVGIRRRSIGKAGVGCQEAIAQGKDKTSWGITSVYYLSYFLCCVPYRVHVLQLFLEYYLILQI